MEAIATGGAANLSSEAAKGIFHEAKRHIRYVIFYQRYVKNFEDKLKKLIEKRRSVQQDIVVAQRNVEKIKDDVQGWCDRVDKLIPEEETDKVKDLQVQAENKCFFGWCPSIKSRYKLSRKAEKDAATFDELIKDCQFNGVGYRDVPRLILHNTGFESFKSREKVFNDIMESLKDSTGCMIGVYGMPGVGKTYLVKEVYTQAQEAKLFDSVVMVTVSQTPDIQRIQDEIAEPLGLKFEEKTTVGRARKLCERLTQEKNPKANPSEKNQEKSVLIILDNIWETLDLEEVGIPFGSQHKGCKILLTSRNKNVLSNGMGATNTFQLGALDDTEAWEFFKKMAGVSFESNEELRSTANDVAKRCAGLPLAISTVARALQNKELFVWKEALRQLQRPYSEYPSQISAEVCKAIELSFNQLPDDALKQTFLLCSLLRRDTRTEDLLRYEISLGLINRVNTLEEARNNLLTKMSYLKEACLLIHSDTGEKYWDVHDLTYIVAKSIASNDYKMFSLGKEDDRTEWPDGESMKKWNQFWLLYPSIIKLPEQLNCPQLNHFLLYSKDHSLTLPTDFFKEATNLKVLALTSMQFSSLPTSICLLTSLSTLSLDRCKLGSDISIIGGLKSLEILSLLKSDIRILPKEIGQLVKLKLLDVSCCANLKTISVDVLSSLKRLEELYMGGTSIQWGQSSTASLAELNTLSRLSTLEVQIPDAKAAPQDFFEGLQKLERYTIFIGEGWEWEQQCECFSNNQYSRIINLRLSTSIDDLDCGIKKLKKTEDLHLDQLKGVKIALQELTNEESLSRLKNLHIQNNLDTEYIINGANEFPQLQSMTLESLPQLISFCPQHKTGATSSLTLHELPLFSEKISFPCLEKLWLKSINVTRVWHNQLSTASFRSYQKLTTLKIEGCGGLKHLFSFSMAKCLQHLTDFEIIRCKCLREIVFMEEIEEESQAMTLFPQLKSLKLNELQHLIGFCFDSQTQVIEFPAIKSMTIDNCPELEGFISSMESNQQIFNHVLFGNKVAFPNLEEMSISNLTKLKMIWQNPLPFPKLREIKIKELPNLKYIWKNDPKGVFSFKNLCRICVEFCWSLKNVFPASVARDFPQLSDLRIAFCGVEEIVSKVKEGSDSETTVTFEFDQLSSLWLWSLPECKCFYPGRHTAKWPMLKELTAFECGKMKIFGTQLITHSQQLDSQPPLFLIEKKKMVVKVTMNGDKPRSKALKIAVGLSGVESASLKGDDRSQIEVTGDGVDAVTLISLLRKNVGHAELLSLAYASGEKKENKKEELKSEPLLCQVIPKLQRLTLGDSYIAMIASEFFHLIKALGVIGSFNKLVNGFQISFLERFGNLEEFSITGCEIKEIFSTRGDVGNKEAYAGPLSTIRKLELRSLQNLNGYLWKQDARVDHILPNLETLQVHNCDKMISLGSSSASFQNLTTLDVWECREMKYLDTCLAVQSLAKLKKLRIRDCVSMKEIVASGGDEATCEINFSRLKSLELVNLPRLESFCSGNHAFGFLCLEEVIASGCPELGIFCKGVINAPLLQSVKYGRDKERWGGDINSTVQHLHSTKVWCQGVRYLVLSEFSKSIEIWKEKNLDFGKLKDLEVEECNSLEYIFSVSMALKLVLLEDLKVKNCPMMEYIIKEGAKETATDTIHLPKLRSIRLESCSDLKSFFLGSITLECPDLGRIEIDDCPKMYAMASPRPEGGGENTPFFNDKVLCASLSTLIVKGCHNLKYLFLPSSSKSFVGLSGLTLVNCESMETVIFTDAAEEGITETYLFSELKVLQLSILPKLGTFCHGDNSDTLFNQKVVFPNLNNLTIKGIGRCGKIWDDKATNTMDSFYELTHLWVEDCARLLNILPLYMVKTLEKLETLSIWECGSLEEIIGPDDDDRLDSNESHTVIELKSTTKFVFPKIQFLALAMLPKLKGFYSKVHTTEWPSLKQLGVRDCSKVETLAAEYIYFQETQRESQPLLSVQQPLFWVTQETFPNLQEICLTRNGNMKEIWHGALPNRYFFNLRSLLLTSVTIPNCFIQSLPNLEKLSVERASLNGLFPSEGLGDGDEQAGTLANLTELRLLEISLPEVFYNQEILQALGCSRLKNLLPPSMSFKHLTTLQVSRCHGFRNLVTFTTAKSMVQLTRMIVTDCQMLEEIIASTPDVVTDGIIFSQLKSLKLYSLPTLSRFCSGNYTLVFPSLEEVIIRQCPKIKFFTKGKLSTPMLHGLQSTKGEYVGHWDGDLNDALQQLFIEKGILSLEDLEISSINIQRVWKHKLLATHSYAQYLTCLTIEGCHNLNFLFSSSMVKSFVQLKKLKVENCENVENVIFVKGFSREEMMNQKTFRVLEFLLLKDLPKLTRFCHGNFFEFPLLTSLCIRTCPTLKAFISDAEGNNSEIASPTLFDEKVAFPCLEEVTIIGVRNWRTIWQKHPTNRAVQVEEFLPKDTYYWKAIIEGKVGM